MLRMYIEGYKWLMYRFMHHNISIFALNSIKFGKLVPEQCIYDYMSSHSLLLIVNENKTIFGNVKI